MNQQQQIQDYCCTRQNIERQWFVELTWLTLVQMACAYLTEKLIPHKYWYWTILHGYRMLNHVSGQLKRKLTSTFKIIHGNIPDPRTWFEPFILGLLHRQSNSTITRSNMQSQTMAGIAIGRFPSSNTITFYNPNTHL